MVTFAEARDFLLRHRTDYAAAVAGFRWPDPATFNWALDWFDGYLAQDPGTRDRPALRIVDVASGTQTSPSFADLSRRSNQAANLLREMGLVRGDRLLLLMGNVQPLWEVTLAAMKLGLVTIPAATLLTGEELRDRVERGDVKIVVAAADQMAKLDGIGLPISNRLVVDGAPTPGWRDYADIGAFPEAFEPDGPTGAHDPMLLYFTSGTTAQPKLVLHSHLSYPAGSLSTMYWLGLRPGDVHLNISSPGWAKHAWSCVFAPWNAGATVFIANQGRFEAKSLLGTIARCGVTSLCAPPTVWRLLVQEDLAAYAMALREVCGAGEPLNPEVIDQVAKAWGLTIRDGYGQTETTAQAGNTPGQVVKAGSMGRVLPGYTLALLDADGQRVSEGEIALPLGPGQTAALMLGYGGEGNAGLGAEGAFYRTGDVAWIDPEGYLTFVGRADDVFKSSGYRISPFELESALIEHAAVAEAAVVPALDPIRLAVPKAYVILAKDLEPNAATAASLFQFLRERLAPFKRVRRIEFVAELPKTISGKIRRVHLRRLEHEDDRASPYRGREFGEDDV